MEQEQLKQMKLQTQEAQAQYAARTDPQPMKMVQGPGIVPGWMPDSHAMDYYQRQAVLPNQAGIQGGGSPSPAGLSGGLNPGQAAVQATAFQGQNMDPYNRMDQIQQQFPGIWQNMYGQHSGRAGS